MNKFNFVYTLTFLLIFATVDYANGQWTQKTSFAGEARHRCTAFSVGNKGYIGGGHINSGEEIVYEDYWQYDPATDSWTQIADFGGGKRYQSTAFSIGDFAYVGLGEDDNDAYHNDFYRYSPEFNIWQPINNYPGNPRRGSSSFVIENRAYVGTGQSDFGYEKDFYRYDPLSNSWHGVTDFIGEERSSSVAFSYNGKGYLGTGHIIGDDTKDFYEYDPVTNSWTQKSDVGPTNRQDATGFVLNGKGYIGTGNDVDGNHNYKDFWEYNFETDTWIQLDDFDGEGRRYMVTFVLGNIAYAGTGTDGTNLKDFWAFNPLLDIGNEDFKKNLVYPNPAREIMTFNFNESFVGIHIYNINGQEVFYRKSISSGFTLSNHDIGNGTFISILNDNEKVISRNIIQFTE